MAIRAKMKVESVTMNGDTEQVSLRAVYANGEANKTWAKATPCGQLTLSINNPGAQGQLLAEKEYFIDITEAPAEG